MKANMPPRWGLSSFLVSFAINMPLLRSYYAGDSLARNFLNQRQWAKSLLPRKNLPDDVFNWHFLNIYVRHRQFVEQGFADRDDALALHFEFNVAGSLLDDLTIFGWLV